MWKKVNSISSQMLKDMNVENFITAWCIKSNKKKIRFLSLFVCVCVCVCVRPVMSDHFLIHRQYLSRLLCHGILQTSILEWVAISFSR